MKASFIIHISLCISLIAAGQNSSLRFKRLSLENGLSQSSITCILKDSRGFMWFGTEDGLNKYDGTGFTVYRDVPNNRESLGNSYIKAIVEQADGFLWIATNNGLNYFNPENEKFTRYLHDPDNAESLSHNEVNSLLLTNDKHLLIGTANGLNIFHPETGFAKYIPEKIAGTYNVVSMAQDAAGFIWVLSTGMIEKIRVEKGLLSGISVYKLPQNSIKTSMFLDSLNLWIGTSKGLIRFNLRYQTFNTFSFYGLNGVADNKNYIMSVLYDRIGKLWLGTNGGGLISFDKETGKFEAVLHNPSDRLSLSANAVTSLFIDEAGIFWVGTFGGISKHDPEQYKFQHYNHHPGDNNSLSNNGVRAVLLDREGKLWVGTHEGLNCINLRTNSIKVYRYDQNNLSTISSDIVRALAEDSKGTIWAGTWDNGLNSFDKKTGKFKRYICLPGRIDSIGGVKALIVDKQDNIWMGGSGLRMFNPATNQYKSYFHDIKNKNSLSGNTINSLYFDKTGLLWIGTHNGLNCLDTVTNIITRYLHDQNDTLPTNTISDKYITSIAEDKNGALWVGTYGGGIKILNVSNRTYRQYNTGNGLLNDVIYGILIDEAGFIWFTSNAGLARFDPDKKKFKYFGTDQGIQSEEFNAGSCFKSKAGEFFFGGINGFNAFYPDSINSKKETSKIVFTGFQLLDDKQTIAKTVLEKHISRTDYIQLRYNQNTFSLTFAELNYSDNADNNYEYQLEGLDKSWQQLGKKQVITIGNLKPGSYTLHVRVGNDLTKMTSVNISVSTPPWRSNWAYAVYTLLGITITGLVYRYVRKNKLIREQFEQKIRNWENNSHPAASLPANDPQPETVSISAANQKFLDHTTRIVEDHLEDSGFDVEKFAGEIFMSRSQLHRRLKTAAGCSATEFIRLIRLKRAAQLLSKDVEAVSEIAYLVGFENVGYFSSCFKKVFGLTPTQYREKNSVQYLSGNNA